MAANDPYQGSAAHARLQRELLKPETTSAPATIDLASELFRRSKVPEAYAPGAGDLECPSKANSVTWTRVATKDLPRANVKPSREVRDADAVAVSGGYNLDDQLM